MKYLGFDVGIRNLGWAIVEYDTSLVDGMVYKGFVAHGLGLIDTETLITNEAVENMCTLFNQYMHPEHGQWRDVGGVNVEQQPEHQHLGRGNMFRKRDNTQMKSMSHAIQGYFIARGVPVRFVNAQAKNNVYDGPPVALKTKSKDKYRQRKDQSIQETKAILHDTGQHQWLEYILSLSKKDDVADAFLQCCYYAKKMSQ
jgi:hypothetical protein